MSFRETWLHFKSTIYGFLYFAFALTIFWSRPPHYEFDGLSFFMGGAFVFANLYAERVLSYYNLRGME